MPKLSPGHKIDSFTVKDLHGTQATIPDTNRRFTHLQFRRFAGCPICNLHLRSVIQRKADIEQAGITEIIFFHSTAAALLPYESDLGLTVIPDAERKWYRAFGVEKSLSGLLNPQSIGAALRGLTAKGALASLNMSEDHTGLPADILLDGAGVVRAVKYGKAANDQWSVDELLQLAGDPN
ncbi:MAG: peroxiredoxin-like family protein [Spirochaetota bacterium]